MKTPSHHSSDKDFAEINQYSCYTHTIRNSMKALGSTGLTLCGSGVCYSIWSEESQACIVSGNNCVEGSPEAVESTYMGQRICGCRCD